jgi:hypothetical protein
VADARGLREAFGAPRRQARSRLGFPLASGLLAASLAGCGAAPVAPDGSRFEPGASTSTLASASASAPDAFDSGYRNIEVLGENLVVVLPDAERWRREPRAHPGWEATHAATGSRLVARAWRAEGRVNAGECERQMRLWRPALPELAPELRVDEHPGKIADYSVEVVASVDAGAQRANGVVSIFGNEGRDCLCLIFSTAARGEGASDLVAARLGTMSRLLERTRRVSAQARALRVEPQL